MMGIQILVVIGVVILSQFFIQGSERRKQYRDLVDRLDKISARSNDSNR